MKIKVILLWIASISLLSLVACSHDSSDSNQTFDEGVIIESLARNVILKNYENLDQAADQLLATVNALEADRIQANLDAAKEAWVAARIPWEQSEAFLFGPVISLNLDPKLDSWPVNREDLKEVLETLDSFSTTLVENLQGTLQGFHTMEFLLFGEGIETNNKPLDDFTEKEFAYLIAVAAVLKDNTAKLLEAWSEPTELRDAYVEELSQAGVKSLIYTSQSAALEELVNGLIVIVDEVGNAKIPDPLGDSLEEADLSLVESQFSWNSLSDFQDNIRGALNIYTGDYDSFTGPGIDEFVAHHDSALSKQVKEEIELTLEKIDQIGDAQNPFREMIIDPEGRIRIQEAIDALHLLQETLQTKVLPLTALSD